MGTQEELKHAQTFAEVRLDGQLDDLARRRSHQTAHTGKLADLVGGTAGAGGRHHVDGVELVQAQHDLVGDVLGGLFPEVGDVQIPFVLAHAAAAELALDFVHLFLRIGDDRLLRRGNLDVRHGYGDRSDGGVLVAHRLDLVQHAAGLGHAVNAVAIVHDSAQLLFAHDFVDLKGEHVVRRVAGLVAKILRDSLVEDEAADRGFDDFGVLFAFEGAGQTDMAQRLQAQFADVVRHLCFLDVGEILAFALRTLADDSQVVAAHDHVLRRADDGFTVLRL